MVLELGRKEGGVLNRYGGARSCSLAFKVNERHPALRSHYFAPLDTD
jgi:hypothetical protein